MAEIQRHRGPDDEGIFRSGPVGLSHRRLSIIDLSETGHQPMQIDNGRFWIVYNGEIYNYVELANELRGRGHVFRSRSDTEVILVAFKEWGAECVTRFDGMWAFAIWDGVRQELFLSRDRLGIKPLHYLDRPECFGFASEIKALLCAFPDERRVDNAFLFHFLSTGLVDDGEETCFAGVRQLPPAHSMLVTTGGARQWRYWDYSAEDSAAYDYSAPHETLRCLLEDSVRIHMRSDVPVGSCLSGGLDSSGIVAFASSRTELPIETFSVVYDEKGYSEGEYAQMVSNAFRCNPHVIRPDGRDFFDVARRMIWHQEVPSAGPSVYSQWHVMNEASRSVKVLLDGQGADELFGGYHWYFGIVLRQQLRSILTGGRFWAVPAFLRYARQVEALTGIKILPNLHRYIYRRAGTRLLGRLPSVHRVVAPGIATELQVAASRQGLIHRPRPRRFSDDLANELFYSTTRDSLPSLLHWEDRNSMAFSLEARVPYLDYRIVDFAMGLPASERINGLTTKYALRRALSGIVPPQITQRTDKLGFPTPFAVWLRDHAWSEASDILSSTTLRQRGIFDVAAIDAHVSQHLSGARDNSWLIWKWISLELWFRTFIDQRAVAAD